MPTPLLSPSDLSLTDIFCGAGGASHGLTAAGWDLKLGANHWDRAIETHAANFPDADHLLADVSNYDMRRLPRTRALWASPICTEVSPANGTSKKNRHGQLDLLQQDGAVSAQALIRTRATAYDVIRATEVHRYDAVMIENVPNFVTKWELFPWWFAGMEQLGYVGQTVSVSSAHVWDENNAPAPQWRDRFYVVFTRKGIPLPDLEPRPLAHCFECDLDVHAVQWWKRPNRFKAGSYGKQYLYRCPRAACRHAIVEPYVLPAASAIDWDDIGTRIGDRPKPLAEATMRRIRTGIEMFAQPTVVAHSGNTWERPGSDYVRAWPTGESPLMARTGTMGEGLAIPAERDGTFVMVNRTHNVPRDVEEPLATFTTGRSHGLVQPFIAELRGGGSTARPTAHPMATLTAGGTHHGLTTPPGAFIQKHHGGLDYAGVNHMVKDVSEPLGTLVGRPNMSLVIPFRRGAVPHQAAARPLSAITTRGAHGVLAPAVEAEDCYFRMLKPREHLRGQRFADDYVITGNQGEQTMQAGNAVSANVAQFIGQRVAAALS